MWRVTDATGESVGTVLRLSSGDGLELIVFRNCGEFSGGWQAGTSGAFVGLVSGFSSACLNTFKGNDPNPAWLARATAYRVNGVERDLLSPDGTVVARLLPGGHPRPEADLIKSLQQPPTLDPATARKLRRPPAPLPSGATPATATTILGTWSSSRAPSSSPYPPPAIQFTAAGTWKMIHDCNGAGGRWVLGAGGEILSTGYPTTAMGCAGPATPDWMGPARRAAVRGAVLTLYAANGQVVARLTH